MPHASTRYRIYLTLTAIQPLLVAYGVSSEAEGVLWLSVASAVLGNGMAAINATNYRQYIYAVLGALAALATFYGLVTEPEATLWVGVVTAFLGNGLAAINTPSEKIA